MNSKTPTTIAGLPTARGYASGPVFIYRGGGQIPIPEYVIGPGQETSELMRLHRAVGDVRRDLEGLISVLKERSGKEDVRVFECHLMLLEDPTLNREASSHITEGRVNAESAVRRTIDGARAQFARMNDAYFRERVRDIDDVERRLLKALTGYDRNPAAELKVPSIIVADDLTPSETVQLPRDLVLGFATNGGSTTSHVALLARALALPAVCGLGDVTSRVEPGEFVLLDGTNGAITVNPDEAMRREFEALVSRQRAIAAEVATGGLPAGTLKDGGEVLVYANVHPGIPLAAVTEYGARGIGLYRSEYLWLDRETEPSEDEQFEAYKRAVIYAGKIREGASACIRALDIGGDKLVRGISSKEANPFLGNRSIRYLLSHRDVMRRQLRAIMRASAFGKVKLMYPMVSCIEEIRECAKMLESVKRDLSAEDIPYGKDVRVGVMIEVPSAALNADAFAREVDFFSIGTNDLVQYTMAADRGNDAVAHLYQPFNPAILRLIKETVAAAKRHGIQVSVCGESAADPIVGVYWASLGVDVLSMSSTYIPVIAKVLASLTRHDLDEYAQVPESMPPGSTAQEIFNACQAWMIARLPGLQDVFL
ncbi:MAG: phosphoenolpyruvate--protein phosphotransferase [Kiritimatiellae bacterium]|nr:phosphoenolpyruvate--protein phosphotransferase [Kiritimatiellia bacterium]